MKGIEEIVFCSRAKYKDGHWYANIGYYCDNETSKAYAGNGQPDVGKLLKWNVKTRETSVLLDAKGGSIRDPQVHYDAGKIVFSYRKANTDYYHLYEIQCDGTGLRQLTSGEFDDYEPCYLPDGGIVFVSTRCKRWVNCWMTQVGVIYRCDADGKNITLISANTEHDNTPWPLPDGRILYTRWEYVDRSQVDFHSLWTFNPDGTEPMVYYGNMHPRIVMIDAKPIPGTNKILSLFSPGHGANEHAGIATIVSPDQGPDEKASARALHKGKLIRDPYPFSEDCILAALDNKIILLDDAGQIDPIYTYAGEGNVHEPRPITQRPRERIIPPRTDRAQATGRLVLSDVYAGRNMAGVKRGDIKKLLILESLSKPVNFSGGPDLLSWLGTFTLERVVGVVPVEEDGSAYFDAPAERQIFFEALDGNDLSVKRMQSFCNVMPGEITGCVGCHEERVRTPRNNGASALLALRRPPSVIQPFEGLPDVVDFTRDVQPILDRRCVVCHNYEKRSGKVVLAGDLGPTWSHSFFTLFARRQIADGRNGLGNQPPRTIGTGASALMQKIGGGHHNVKLDPREWRMVWLWIESGATYAGTYAALRNEMEQAADFGATGRVFREAGKVLQRRCRSCHSPDETDPIKSIALPYNPELRKLIKRDPTKEWVPHERIVFENDPIARFSPNILLDFTHPRQSPLLLGPLAKSAKGWGSCGEVFKDDQDPDFRILLSAIENAQKGIDAEPRFATPGFKPNWQYVREMKKYGILPASFNLAKDEINIFDTDQKYWRSLWHQPVADSSQ
ncbi:MAG: hypothetical protein NTX50_20785 [Candidatus Sumerlaeota bacterium]|nr:hypothetical protein [Candidatus Sumerlaeota bacterium]